MKKPNKVEEHGGEGHRRAEVAVVTTLYILTLASVTWMILSAGAREPSHAGPPGTVPLYAAGEADPGTRLRWVFLLAFKPSAVAGLNVLHAYEPRDVEGRIVYPDRVGPTAVITRCGPRGTDEDHRWCAKYFGQPDEAYRAARRTSDRERIYFGTTYPMRNAARAASFVTEYAPTHR